MGRITLLNNCSLGAYTVGRYTDTGVRSQFQTMSTTQDNDSRLGRRCYLWQVSLDITRVGLLGDGTWLGRRSYPQEVAWMPWESPFYCAFHITCWWLLDNTRIRYSHESCIYSCLYVQLLTLISWDNFTCLYFDINTSYDFIYCSSSCQYVVDFHFLVVQMTSPTLSRRLR